MRITIFSSTFLPNIGGLENIMSGLANSWTEMDQSVQVATNTEGEVPSNYAIIRKPSLYQLFKLAQKSDIFIEANISLKTVVVGLFNRKKWVVIHHIPYLHQKSIAGIIKQWLTYFSHNISVSEFVQKTIPGKSIVIPNFYNSVFDAVSTTEKTEHTVFVGRLVSDKGVDFLLNAIALLIKEYPTIQITIIGDGPEKENLIQLCKKSNLQNHVSFINSLDPILLAKKLATFKWLVIPSLWEEPFGLVALEGLAAGCTVIASDGGGLTEVLGNFGILFKRGNKDDLVAKLQLAYSTDLVQEPEKIELLKQHLAIHQQQLIAKKYINYFSTILDS